VYTGAPKRARTRTGPQLTPPPTALSLGGKPDGEYANVQRHFTRTQLNLSAFGPNEVLGTREFTFKSLA
jgi:hypothetical protein